MAQYITKLGDTEIFMEAAAAGGLSKGSSKANEGNPLKAASNMIKTAVQVSAALSRELAPMARGTGAGVEVTFAVRANSTGLVMVSENSSVGQFKVTVKIGGGRPRPARPPGTQPRPKRPPQAPAGGTP
jgi:hypothetical protein